MADTAFYMPSFISAMFSIVIRHKIIILELALVLVPVNS